MTSEQLSERLAKRPEMCQTWVDARMLRDDGGVLYLSGVVDSGERMGAVHIYIWDKAAMRDSELIRRTVIELMRHHRLDRLVCEINRKNRLAINLARQLGGNTIGIIRQRKDGRGERHDFVLMDGLLSDLSRRQQCAA